MSPRLLIVEDDEVIRFALEDYLSRDGFDIVVASGVEAALVVLADQRLDLAVVDLTLPDGSGLALISRLRADFDLGIVVLTGRSELDTAMEALRGGADHFVAKPCDLATLSVLLRRTLEERRTARISAVSAASTQTRPDPMPFGRGEATRRLSLEAMRAASAEAPVLILGETGTGKGLLARWLHAHSLRASEPMVELNCASLSREMAESELFGHERGAFTGAVAHKAGLLELAHRGTLFLDEVGELELAVQSKLLKVLEDQRFRRIGSVQERQVSVRLIAATSLPLEAMLADGRFRSDLYYRFSTLVLRVPPLRERLDELAPLCELLLAEVSPRHRLTGEAIRVLASHAWPGNVRELRNVLERASLFASRQTIDGPEVSACLVTNLPPSASAGGRVAAASAEPPRATLADVERGHIEAVVRACDGRVDRAAEWLGIPRSTLYQRLRRYGIKSGPEG